MIQLTAPWPNAITTIVLPNPQLGDAEGLTSSVSLLRAMDGLLRTYVKTTNSRRQLQLRFILTRSKGEEFKRYLFEYGSNQHQLADHLGRVWLGYFTDNPFELDTAGRNSPGGDLARMEIQINFEGAIQ